MYLLSMVGLAFKPATVCTSRSGDREGQHSIRINDQWRICFVRTPAGPVDVEIVDYH